jgi:Zn-dependent protease with chaperone function
MAPPKPRGASLRLDVPAGDTAAATALAWSQAMAMLADRIAADLAH